MAFSTLDAEGARLGVLASTGRVAVDTVGSSVQGRPVRLLRIGRPPPAAGTRAVLLLMGAQHGDEPAGREGLLAAAEHLAAVEAVDVRLRQDGVSGDFTSTPDHSSLDITGDLDLRVEFAPDQWASGAIQNVLSKYTTTGNQRSYTLRLSSTGELQMVWSANGTNLITRTCTAPVPAGDGQRIALRATVDVDDGAGDNVTRFFWAATIAGPWAPLGDPRPGSGTTTSIFSSTAVLEIGSTTGGTAGLTAGWWWAAQVRNGIDGTIVANPVFSAQTAAAGSFADSTGKTWTVTAGAALVDVGDPDLVDLLTDHGVLIVPTPNPDGIANDTRTNANVVDLNRDWLALSQPEVRPLAQLLGLVRPLVLVDHHEADPQLSANVTFAPPSNPQCDSGIVDEADALITLMKARMTADGWSEDDFGDITGGPDRLVSNAGMRHGAAVLVESSVSQTEAARTAQHLACAEEAWQYVVANLAALLDEADDAAGRVAAAGAAGDAFDLNNGTVLDPAPLGYALPGVLPEFHLSAFGIAVISPNTVSMAQSGQPIIPYLFDAASDHVALAGIRLTSLPVPAVVATVAEFAAVVSGSHEPLIEALLVTGFQSGFNPTGLPLPIIDGDVQYDATADIFATLSLTTEGVDEQTGRSRFPRTPAADLAPYGTEVFVRRGVDLGNQIIWSPLGYFRLITVEQTGGSESPIALTGSDRMWTLIRSPMLAPRVFAASTSVAAFVSSLVSEVYPAATVAFDDAAAFEPIGRQIVVDESRAEPLREVADGLGKVIYWDGAGALRIESPPSDDVPAWRVAAGRDGVLVDSARRVSTENAFNGVIILGTGGGGGDPVRGVAIDIGAKSPTRWGGPFGKILPPGGPIQLPTVTTTGQATVAAREMLRRNLGAPYSADFGAVVNPALRPRMPVMVVQRDGNRELHVMQTVTVPLVVGPTMTGTTRERTHVSIGSVIS
jgi:hypothetical protein